MASSWAARQFVAASTPTPSANGTLSGRATISVPSNLDPSPAHNSAPDIDTILAPADLSMTKTDGLTEAVPGQTITLHDRGLQRRAQRGERSDRLRYRPRIAPLHYLDLHAAAEGAICGGSVHGGSVSHYGLHRRPAGGGTATCTVSGTLSPQPPEACRTQRPSTLPAGYGDPNLADNSATDTDLI